MWEWSYLEAKPRLDMWVCCWLCRGIVCGELYISSMNSVIGIIIYVLMPDYKCKPSICAAIV